MCLSRLSLKTPCLFGCDISWEQVPAINLLNEEINYWTISCWEPLTQASKAQLHCATSVLLLLCPQTVQDGIYTAGLLQKLSVSLGVCREVQDNKKAQREEPHFPWLFTTITPRLSLDCPHRRSLKNSDIRFKELIVLSSPRPRFCVTHPEWTESRAY